MSPSKADPHTRLIAAGRGTARGGGKESGSTRERIRGAAAALFAQRGYSGASMAEIALRVGIRKPSLYNHYSSKEELFMDLLHSGLRQWRALSSGVLAEAGQHEERLRLHLHHLLAFAAKNPDTMAICRLAVVQIGGEYGERLADVLSAHREEYQDRLEDFFARATEAGEVVAEKPRVLMLSWLVFLEGLLTRQLLALDEHCQPHLEQLWRLFWRGIRAYSPGEEAADG